MRIHRGGVALGAAVLGLVFAACSPSTTDLNGGDLPLPGELWVTSQGGDVIYIRDFQTLSPIARIDLPPDNPGTAGVGPHIVTFHTPNFAYVAGMKDGKVYVIDATTRRVVQTLQVGPTLAHQVKVAPDGRSGLVSIIGTRTVTKLLVDEANRSWSVGPSLDVGAATGKAPYAQCSAKTVAARSSR
ncbi:MAG: YncE family protein [Gemmatimonadaceae bacterium]